MLPLGTIVLIRNVSTGAAALPPFSTIHGGVDPVAVSASSGDQLQLWIRNVGTRSVMATVPDRRAPAVVSTSVQNPGEFDPPPRVVFSEPIDPGTVPGHVRITRGATMVSDRFAIVRGEPWVAELDPAVELEPAMTYELTVDDAVRDLAGEPLQAPWTLTFSTIFRLEGSGRIAFSSDREGDPNLYAVQADGTGLRRIAAGWAPAWSPDGTRIAFYRDGIHVIDADGSNERLLVADGHEPAWTFDGRRIAFMRGWDLYVVNADGSEEAVLVRASPVSIELRINAELHSPAWSLDGSRIAFTINNGRIASANGERRLFVGVPASNSRPRRRERPLPSARPGRARRESALLGRLSRLVSLARGGRVGRGADATMRGAGHRRSSRQRRGGDIERQGRRTSATPSEVWNCPRAAACRNRREAAS